jgi:hypothetical protein
MKEILNQILEEGLIHAKKNGKNQKQVFKEMGLTERAANTAKSRGTLLQNIENFLAFVRVTRYSSAVNFLLEKTGFESILNDIDNLKACEKMLMLVASQINLVTKEHGSIAPSQPAHEQKGINL